MYVIIVTLISEKTEGRANMKKISRIEKAAYVVAGVILVLAISVLMSVRVQSRTREAVLFDNTRYEACEENYRQQINSILETYDVYNSGLTMTRVVSMDGERSYSLLIYNGKFSQMDELRLQALQKELSQHLLSLPDGTGYEVNLSLES